MERYREMARVAVSGRLGGGVRGFAAQLAFDMRLTWDWLKMSMMKFGMKMALRLGYLPPEMLAQMEETT